MMTKSQTDQGILCKGICTECNDRFECYQSNYKATEDEKFAFKFYEKYSRQSIILALGNYQTSHVDASNEAYHYKKNIKALEEWLKREITAVDTEEKKSMLKRVLAEMNLTGMIKDE